ncbi:WXG100 family type VII secretion target [Actinokineospora enzanensis]|uniref:WXG100 family type VII secretion target n=1 Tax=Actinokineospora enzanensis TaxID=155975 RepID=UPI0003759C3C|nr:PPE domain-containing protein [Actinokineospora enzanensis]
MTAPTSGPRLGTDLVLTEPVNWSAYTHPQLYYSVHMNVDPATTQDIAGEWERLGADMGEAVTRFAASVRDTESGWEGDAADAARASTMSLVSWGSATAATATTLSVRLGEQGILVERARAAMPEPVVFDWQSMLRAAFGGSGIGGFLVLLQDMSRVNEMSREAHERAVDVMTELESNSREVDVAMPVFALPPNGTQTVDPALNLSTGDNGGFGFGGGGEFDPDSGGAGAFTGDVFGGQSDLPQYADLSALGPASGSPDLGGTGFDPGMLDPNGPGGGFDPNSLGTGGFNPAVHAGGIGQGDFGRDFEPFGPGGTGGLGPGSYVKSGVDTAGFVPDFGPTGTFLPGTALGGPGGGYGGTGMPDLGGGSGGGSGVGSGFGATGTGAVGTGPLAGLAQSRPAQPTGGPGRPVFAPERAAPGQPGLPGAAAGTGAQGEEDEERRSAPYIKGESIFEDEERVAPSVIGVSFKSKSWVRE